MTIALPGAAHVVRMNFTAPGGDCVAVGLEPRDGEPEPAPISAAELRELADRYGRLEHHARSSLAIFVNGGDSPARRARTRRELSPEFLRDVARRHDELGAQGLPPTHTLAREHGVSVGAVKNWLRHARDAGVE